MPEPDPHQHPSATTDDGSTVPQPPPADDLALPRRRRLQRFAGTVGLAVAVIGIAGGSYALTRSHPEEVTPMPLVEPAAPGQQPSPLPDDVLTGERAVTLQLTDHAEIVAGYDDDDRVVVEATRGKDYGLRNRWLLRPAAGHHQLVQVTERPGGNVCAAVEDNALRIRVCNSGDTAQQFDLATATEQGTAAAEDRVLLHDRTTVRRDGDNGLVIRGGAASVLFRVVPEHR